MLIWFFIIQTIIACIHKHFHSAAFTLRNREAAAFQKTDASLPVIELFMVLK